MADDCPESTIEKAVKASEGGGWLTTNLRAIITLATLTWIFSMSFTLLFVTSANEKISLPLLVLLTNILTGLIGYHFGSSEGSRLKTILDRMPKE